MMTENPWPQTSDPHRAGGYDPAGTTAASAAGGDASAKAGAVKDEAGNVAGEAAGAARHVTESAVAEVANVASEVKTNARDLLHQAKSDLTSQAEAQQQKAAEGIRKISEELRTMAGAPEEQGVAADIVRQAADRSASVASWLENRDPGSLLDEAKSFARQRPAAFLLLAAGAGMLAGRLGRSLQAGVPTAASTTGTPVPPRPVQSPVMDGSITPGAGAPVYGQTPAPAVPVYGETVYGEPAGPGFDGPGPAGVPLRDPVDPFVQGEGSQL